jgi:hypothetical protein
LRADSKTVEEFRKNRSARGFAPTTRIRWAQPRQRMGGPWWGQPSGLSQDSGVKRRGGCAAGMGRHGGPSLHGGAA